MKNWSATSPLLAHHPLPRSTQDVLAELDGWSIAELLRGERFEPPTPDAPIAPTPPVGARAEPVTAARQPAWLANAQWQATPGSVSWPEPPSIPRSAISDDPFERAAIRTRRRTPRRSPMGPPLLNQPPQDYPSHLGPVPQAPDWEQAVTGPSPWSPLAMPPRATDWGRATAAIDEAAEAQGARDAAATRTGRWRRRNQRPYEGYTERPVPPDADRDVGERARLNFLDAYYRGTLFGAARLALMSMINELRDEGVSADTRRARGDLRNEYQQVLADLERYDRMRPFVADPAEYGASVLGQFGGLAFNGILGAGPARGLTRMARYGREVHIGPWMRIAPFGNRTGHATGRWPHYHRRRPDPSRPGHSLPRQSDRRHRPWDTHENDTSIYDRF